MERRERRRPNLREELDRLQHRIEQLECEIDTLYAAAEGGEQTLPPLRIHQRLLVPPQTGAGNPYPNGGLTHISLIIRKVLKSVASDYCYADFKTKGENKDAKKQEGRSRRHV